MKITDEMTDETLVAQSVEGNRDAFREIVRRYQVLLCSVAYSAGGNVSQSEDVAQETLVAAWTRLGTLREPAKLKAWLCGIARNLAHNSSRRELRRATESFDLLDGASQPVSEEPRPDEAVSRADDEALTWRALESVPELYRETLVLYYRQHESIEHVAVLLDVTEETVRQRLSRGRKALQDQVLSLLGSTLTRTVPAVAFTASVMSALPVMPIAAAAGGAALGTGSAMGTGSKLGTGSALAKSGGAAKAVSLTLLGASALAGFLGAMGLILGNKVSEELSDSTRELDYVRGRGRGLWFLLAILCLGLPGIFFLWPWLGNPSVPELAITGMGFVATWALALFAFVHTTTQRQTQIRVEEAQSAGRYRYVSPGRFLGLPWIAVNLADGAPTRAWIAVGQIAEGGFLAVGQLAIAPIALGACGLGLFTFAAIGTGWLSFSAIAIGWWSAGAFAFGNDAIGAVAIASHFAAGGVAWASQFAEGARALAEHANDPAAFHALQMHPLFRFYYLMPWLGAVQAAVALIPNLVLLKRLQGRRLKQVSRS